MQQPIELQLSLEEINQILKALGRQPFAEVETLVERIRKQTFTQLQQTVPSTDEQHPEAE